MKSNNRVWDLIMELEIPMMASVHPMTFFKTITAPILSAIEDEKQQILSKRVWVEGEEKELAWVRKNRPNAKTVPAHLVGAIKNIQDVWIGVEFDRFQGSVCASELGEADKEKVRRPLSVNGWATHAL